MIRTRFLIRKPNGSSVLSTHLKDLSPVLTDFITSTEKGARVVAAVAAADHLIGDGRRGLKHYPPYKYISRKRAYGKTFQSDKQRRYVMAMIREGKIDPGAPKRTGRLQRGWVRGGRGTDIIIKNTAPHVLPVMGDETQSRHERLVGWRMVSDVIESNLKGAQQAAERAVDKYYEQKAKE